MWVLWTGIGIGIALLQSIVHEAGLVVEINGNDVKVEEEGDGPVVRENHNSHSRGLERTVRWMLSAKAREPRLFGWRPSILKKDTRFQNRLKLSMKPSFWVLHSVWSQ